MTCAAAIQNDTIWLESRTFDVVPLNEKLAPRVQELRTALCQGMPAYNDESREDFYEVGLESGWFYVHVHEDAQTVYLVAFTAN